MAKNMKRKPRPSWFQKQLDRVGEQALERKPAHEIQREAFNIVRDIARDNITPRDFKYLFNPTMLENVKQAVYEKYLEQLIYQTSMNFVLQHTNGMNIYGMDPNNFQKVYNSTCNILTAYTSILQGLDAMISAIQLEYINSEARQNQYLQVYSSVQYQISRFRYII